jgi:hypothetical protein
MQRSSTASVDAGSRVDKDLAARAYRKLLDGGQPTREERAALRRFEKAKDEKLRWQHYESIPQKHWRRMSGRQTKVLQEQAARYGIPFGGASVNLPAVVRALHDFLADNAQKLAREDDVLLQGASSPALEEYREERTKLARLERRQREGSLIPRDEAREALGRIAAVLRGAGDELQRQFGAEALAILDEALQDAEREIERAFGEEHHGQH